MHRARRTAGGWWRGADTHMDRPSILILATLLAGAAGCFRERSFPIAPHDYVALSDVIRVAPTTTRQWLLAAHEQFEPLLPIHARSALLTESLTTADGGAVSVARHFWAIQGLMRSIWYNAPGIAYSAQSTGSRFETAQPPPWPGFEDVWIPINERLSLAGRLGIAQRGGQPVRSICVVLVPGLFGDNWTARSRDLALALLDAGFHVLSLEQRGHGQTETRYPDVPYTYGVYETGDLLAVAEWLQQRPEVTETGLVGFCWGANEALLVAWEDGRDELDPDVSSRLRERLRPRGPPCYRAGIIAFSPPVRFEDVIERIDRQRPAVLDPVTDSLAQFVEARARQKGYEGVDGRLSSLVAAEARVAEPDDPHFHDDGLRYLRLLPHRGAPCGPKLGAARTPVLIVHAANDPIGNAQDIADLVATTNNPNVAAIVLPDGGHCGFAAYARGYFYSLVINFFDRERGAAACARRSLALR